MVGSLFLVFFVCLRTLEKRLKKWSSPAGAPRWFSLGPTHFRKLGGKIDFFFFFMGLIPQKNFALLTPPSQSSGKKKIVFKPRLDFDQFARQLGLPRKSGVSWKISVRG